MKTDYQRDYIRLQAKHDKLEKEHEQLRCFHEQLLHEAPKEKKDLRRSMLLKTRLFMLDRQCHNMTIQLNERQLSVQQAHSAIEAVTLDMESWFSSSKPSKENVVETIKKLKGVMRQMNNPCESSETVNQRILIKNKFSDLTESPGDAFRYNAKQISNLEHKLCDLTNSMEQLKFTMADMHQSADAAPMKSLRIKYDTCFASLTKKLDDCCYDLTLLSMLQPQLPLKNSKISKSIDLAGVMSYLKKHRARKEVHDVVPVIWKSAHHHCKLQKSRSDMLEKELMQCHERLKLHTNYVMEILSGLEGMFLDFEKSVLTPVLTEPLSSVIHAFNILQNEQTDASFTNFFKDFNALIPELQRVVSLIKSSVKMQRTSELQNSFKKQIQSFTKECLIRRAASEDAMLCQEKEENLRKEALEQLLNK